MDPTAPALDPIGMPPEAIGIFVLVVAFSIWLDLFSHRHTENVNMRDATLWSLFWIGVSLCWYAYLRVRYATGYADLFLAGYALEKSLSVDNLMVFVAIFQSFGLTGHRQLRVLYYGIMGAIVFRFAFISLGTGLLMIGPFILFVFAGIVLWSAWKMFTSLNSETEEIEDFTDHFSVRWGKRFFHVFPRLDGEAFFISNDRARELAANDSSIQLDPKATRYATPMFLCLLAILASDVMFSFDSVPAVIAVTQQPLLVYSSIIFAVLGLRSLYFVLAALQAWLCHLDKAVIALLAYIGVKLGAEAMNHVVGWPDLHISPGTNVLIVLGTLGIGVIASFVFPEREDHAT